MPNVPAANFKRPPGKPGRALEALRRKLDAEGGSAADWNNYGELLLSGRRFADSLHAFETAVARAPGNTRFLRGLAVALSQNRRYEEAIRIRQSLEYQNAQDTAVLADDLKHAHEFAAAIGVVDAADAQGKAIAAAKVMRGMSKLFIGDYRGGFADLEFRFEANMALDPGTVPAIRWNGAQTPGLRILFCPDQGLGDDIMMARFLPAVHEAGLKATFLARPPLERLLRASESGADVVGRVRDLSAFDGWCPIGSLPHMLGMDGPPPGPTALAVPPEAVERGAAITAPFAQSFRIGVCWTGNPKYPRNELRSMSPRGFEAIAGLPGVRLFSLARGAAVDALEATGMGDRIVDACSDEADFADTAGLISALDLVISTDTAVVHLAASLGKPVWNLLPWESFWQYGVSGESTPWYPSMRLFRQPRRGDWDSVLRQVRKALSKDLQARSGETKRSS
jgi:hypothetical protein